MTTPKLSEVLADKLAPLLDLRVRDLLDLSGAAALSLGMFGAPVALGLANLMVPFELDTAPLSTMVEARGSERVVQFSAALPAPEQSAPATALAPEPKRGEAPSSDGIEENADDPAPDDPAPDAPAPDAPEETDPLPTEPEAVADAAPEAPAPSDNSSEAAVDTAEATASSDGVPPHMRVLAVGRRIDPRVLRRAVANSNPANAVRLSAQSQDETAGTRVSEARKKRRRGRRCEDATGDIREVADHTYEVERSLVDMYVKDLELAQSLASVAWHRDERGKIDGFRIRRIRCGNVLHQAGFRNGDVVHTVNGKKIRTVFGAIAAYRKLKRKEHLRIDATDRDGAGKKLKFHIS